MLRKLMLSLAAVATLGAAAFVPGAASAAPWGWHGHWHGWYGHGPYYGRVYSGCVVRRWVPTPWGPRLRWVNVCY